VFLTKSLRPLILAAVLATLALVSMPSLYAGALSANATTSKVHLLGTGDHLESLKWGGISRTFIVHVPIGAPVANRPLILVYHGAANTAAGTISITDFEQIADRVGDVVVFMQGYRDTWDELAGDGYAVDAHIDDIGFTRAVLRALIPLTSYNGKRVALVGFSNGAEMVETLGCRLAASIRLVVPVEGEILSAVSPGCAPSRPVNVYEIHGTADASIPYAGGVFFGIERPVSVLSALGSVARWAQLDGCGASPKTTSASSITLTQYTSCAEGVSVTLRTIIGGTHEWPGNIGELVTTALGH
jgi:polyhydroxybutyrate depolymerase